MLRSFPKGGIHPEENKISAGNKIQNFPLPKLVHIPLIQHMGAPAAPLVNPGDEVKTGQIIARSQGFVSSNIHSSVSGKVVKVDKTTDISGYKRSSFIIKVNGDEWIPEIDRSPDLKSEITSTPEEIIRRTMEAGIVGLGGATFPSHVKLSIPRDKAVQVLILNGVECEPYLTADYRLMLEKGNELIIGMKLLMKALKVEAGIIGTENNKPDAIAHLNELSKDEPDIFIEPLKVKYPQGGEKQLIKALTNREVPSGGLPVDVGVIVHNVGTAFAIYEAVQKNKPLFERVVTVTGKSVGKPSNFLVRIGTPVRDLIEAVGGLPEDTGKIISGGPMMGKALNMMDIPVTKGTSGILMIPQSESKREKTFTCIRCAKCVKGCPMGLEPYLLMALVQNQVYEEVETNRTMDCIECGSCSYSCPSNRPLLDYIRLGKAIVSDIIKSRRS